MPADLRALLDAATPGPWGNGGYPLRGRDGPEVLGPGDALLLTMECRPNDDADANLIVALRNAAPTLLDIAEAAQALVDDTLANAGNCPSCGEEDGEHTTDCRFAPLVAALSSLNPQHTSTP